MKKILVCFSFLLSPLWGMAAESPWSVSLSPGYALPEGDTKDVAKGGFSIDGAAEYRCDDYLSVGLEAGSSMHKAEGTLNRVSFTSDIHDTFIHATPYVKLGDTLFLPVYKVRPYLFAGAGYYHAHYGAGTVTTMGSTIPIDGASDDFSGMNLGGGFDVLLTERLSLGVIIHYHQIFEPGSNDKLVVPAVRIAYAFN